MSLLALFVLTARRRRAPRRAQPRQRMGQSRLRAARTLARRLRGPSIARQDCRCRMRLHIERQCLNQSEASLSHDISASMKSPSIPPTPSCLVGAREARRAQTTPRSRRASGCAQPPSRSPSSRHAQPCRRTPTGAWMTAARRARCGNKTRGSRGRAGRPCLQQRPPTLGRGGETWQPCWKAQRAEPAGVDSRGSAAGGSTRETLLDDHHPRLYQQRVAVELRHRCSLGTCVTQLHQIARKKSSGAHKGFQECGTENDKAMLECNLSGGGLCCGGARIRANVLLRQDSSCLFFPLSPPMTEE